MMTAVMKRKKMMKRIGIKSLSADRSVLVDEATVSTVDCSGAPELNLKGKSSGCTACCRVISSLIETMN